LKCLNHFFKICIIEIEAIERREENQKIEEMALLKQQTDFRMEKQKFDSDKAKLLADRSLFENTKSSFEKQLNDAMMAYEQAGKYHDILSKFQYNDYFKYQSILFFF